MGRKTQLHLGQTLDSQSRNIYECFIYDQNDKGFCVVTGSTSECQELIKKKDLIITAVNVMPEMKTRLSNLYEKMVNEIDPQHSSEMGINEIARILEKLEAVK